MALPDDAAPNAASLKKMIDEMKECDIFKKEFEIPENELQLTPEENQARNDWVVRRKQLDASISQTVRTFVCRTQDDLLGGSIVPPVFKSGKVSPRSTMKEQRSGQYYPPELHRWDNFDAELEQPFENANASLSEFILNPIVSSFGYKTTMADEKQEEAFLREQVWAPFGEAGLFQGVYHNTSDDVSRRNVTVLGLPDNVSVFVSDNDEKVRPASIVEVKASHNLLIPNELDYIIAKYKKVFENQVACKSADESAGWSRIGHPLAQLFNYMIDNKVGHGALCSASKTYFVSFEKGIDGLIVRVTRAWHTCEKNFLRAWASFFRAAEQDIHAIRTEENLKGMLGQWCSLQGRMTSSAAAGEAGVPSDKDNGNKKESGGDYDGKYDGNGRNDKAQRNGSKAKCKNRTPCSCMPRKKRSIGSKNATISDGDKPQEAASPTLERAEVAPTTLERVETPNSIFGPYFEFEKKDFVRFVPFEELVDQKYLATGRNGDVFVAQLDGKPFAVKQFDLNKNYDSYEREVRAYQYLRDVWGELVPSLEFFSASVSGNVRFLGMTLGDSPKNKTLKDCYALMGRLEREYNFRHLDNDYGRNCIEVEGRLLLIDLEYWEETTDADDQS